VKTTDWLSTDSVLVLESVVQVPDLVSVVEDSMQKQKQHRYYRFFNFLLLFNFLYLLALSALL
jgi:hypothetical protein